MTIDQQDPHAIGGSQLALRCRNSKSYDMNAAAPPDFTLVREWNAS